jgi:ribosomal protein L11 methyltransferase
VPEPISNGTKKCGLDRKYFGQIGARRKVRPMALVKLVVRTPKKLSELVSTVLFEAGAGGIEELENGRRLLVYAATQADADGIAERARALLREAAPGASGIALSVELDENSDWDSAWTKHLGQIELTPKIVIQPVWDQTPAPIGAKRILFDPRLAFGDGAHATTRLASASLWNECERFPGGRVLDFGCGTGVLAFVALICGAAAAWGVDIDPVSVEAARRNAELNGLGNAAHFCLPHELEQSEFDIVVANLEAPTLLRVAPDLGRWSAQAKLLILTGFLADRVDEIVAAFAPSFEVADRFDEEDWTALDLAPKRGLALVRQAPAKVP